MKRILLILSTIVLLTSCTRNSQDEYIDGNPDKQTNIMKRISSNTDGCFYTEVWVDTETGCEYFFVRCSTTGVAMIQLTDAEGKPKIRK